MTSETPSSSSRSPFLLTSDSGLTADLTELIEDGAKLTVLFDQLVADWHISHRDKWAYHRLRRQCLKWEKEGLIEYSEQLTYDSWFVGIEQRPGIFVKAKTPNTKTPNLIRSLQNSKSVAEAQKTVIFENGVQNENSADPQDKLNWLPGNKIGWYRQQAIRRLQEIRNPTLFIRDHNADGTSSLNPSLKKMQNQVSKLFEAWKQDCLAKVILLKDADSGKYLKLNYKTRFTDPFRHWQNEKTYRAAINKSTEMFDSGVFITLTADPQIHMRKKGEEFERYVKDPSTGNTYKFDLTGKGGNLWSANRSESRAWRGWYERMCHRYKRRIPYIRVVEFQKNGLIHTHLLLFGITWEDSWEQLARDWGERYGQGIMNQVYRVRNVNGVWQWANSKEQPTDTKGRSPADYLGKYLKKASDIPTIKCPHCGKVVSAVVAGKMECPDCHAQLKAPRDGRYMYWATGKRFFTISQCLRDEDFDEDLLKETIKEISPYNWEFVGAPFSSEADEVILKDIRKNDTIPATMDGWISPDRRIREERYMHDLMMKRHENPDINDDDIAESVMQSLDQLPEAQISVVTPEDNWKEMLELERKERAARRERLRKIKEETQNEKESHSNY